MEKRLGFIGIIIEDRKRQAARVNEILSMHSDIIIARIGLPYKEKECNVITLIIDSTTDDVGMLTGRLGKIPGISVKSALSRSR